MASSLNLRGGKMPSSNLTNCVHVPSFYLTIVCPVPTLTQLNQKHKLRASWSGPCHEETITRLSHPPAPGSWIHCAGRAFHLGRSSRGLRSSVVIQDRNDQQQGERRASAEPPRWPSTSNNLKPQNSVATLLFVDWSLGGYGPHGPSRSWYLITGRVKKCFPEMGLRRMDRSKLKSA